MVMDSAFPEGALVPKMPNQSQKTSLHQIPCYTWILGNPWTTQEVFSSHTRNKTICEDSESSLAKDITYLLSYVNARLTTGPRELMHLE